MPPRLGLAAPVALARVAAPKASPRSPGSGTKGGMTRMASGKRVLSTRMTSAPRQPQIKVAWAPKPSRVKSRMRRPVERHGQADAPAPAPPDLWRHGADDTVISDTRVRERRSGLDAGAASPAGARTTTGGPMQLEDLVLVSVDDHVVEPPDMFEGRMPARFADQAPRVDVRDDGTEIWRFDGKEATNIGLNAVAGRPVEEYGIEPTSFAEIRSGCYDIHDRVRDMDANGVIASMCFPSFPQLCGQLFAKASDPELGLAVLRAYNDWHIDEWCGTYPGRFIPLSLPPIWDPAAMADEVRRVAAKGCHAVSFSENPSKLKLPSFHSDHWDPFWAACSDEGTIVCLHIGSSSSLVVTAPDAPIDVLIGLQPVNIVQAAADLLWSPVLRKFPDLQGGAVGGRDRLDPVLPRPDGLDLHAPPRLDGTGLRQQAAQPGLRRAGRHLFHRRPRRHGAAPSGRHRLDVLGVGLPPLRLDLAPVARDAHEVARRGPRRGHREVHPPQRHAPLPVRPLRAPPQGAVHGGGAARPGRSTWT